MHMFGVNGGRFHVFWPTTQYWVVTATTVVVSWFSLIAGAQRTAPEVVSVSACSPGVVSGTYTP